MPNLGSLDLSGFDFANMTMPELNMPEQNWMGKMKDMFANPEFLAIALDMAGQSIGGPTTPFGGVGTAMGQSSLANKARIEQQAQMQQFREMLAQAFGGGEVAATPKSEVGSMSEVTRGLTAGDKFGDTSTTTKRTKDGGLERTTKSLIQEPEKNEYKSLSDFMSNPNF